VCEAAGTRCHIAICDKPKWWERIVGNLYSVNEDVKNRGLLEELCELCDVIEAHLEGFDRLLEEDE
jgi:sulfur transfer complex TusBCD TusB component (DsrH family)